MAGVASGRAPTYAVRSWWDGPWPWLAYLVTYGIPWLWRPPTMGALLLSIVGLTAFVSVYLVSFRLRGEHLAGAVGLLTAIAVLMVPVGGGWSAFAVYPAMQAAKLRPRRLAIRTVAISLAAFFATGLVTRQPLFWWAPSLIMPALVAGATLSAEAFRDQTQALLASQKEVRRLAGLAERERMAGDLHDVVGRTLTLIAIRADLVKRLAARDGEAARAEAALIGSEARAGLSQVRSALDGLAGGNLAQEVEASLAALRLAGVQAESRGDPHALSPDAAALLAMVLREAVTNVIRHAEAGRCVIEITCSTVNARLAVSDDGRWEPFEEGVGLTAMRRRLVAAGGRLAVLTDQPGSRVVASVPS